MQIANTLNSPRSPFGLRKCRQQKGNQNPDDGNHDQQLNQCKSFGDFGVVSHVSLDGK
jgi:hypothetical protein